MKKTRGVVLLVMVLAGCQSSPRVYDGVLGYQVESRDERGLILSYTDEATWAWEAVEERALQACARELNQASDALKLRVAAREQLSKPVNLAVLVPMAGGAVVESKGAHPLGPGLSAGSGAVYNRTETVLRELKLKKMSAHCTIAAP